MFVICQNLSKLKFVIVAEIVLLADKLSSDSRSISSLESCDSDQPLKSLDISSLSNAADSTVVTDSATRVTTSNMPASTSDVSDCSLKPQGSLPGSDGYSPSDTAGLRLSSTAVASAAKIGAEYLQSSCTSTASMIDKNISAENTDQSLKDSVKDVTLQNLTPENLVTSVVYGLHDACLSSSMHASSDVVKDHNGAVNKGLCVSIDTTLTSKGITATIMSPSEDFQSIYASNDNPLMTSATTTHVELVPEPEPVHDYADLDGVDAWLEFPVPEMSTTLSLSVSRQTVWYIDKAERLYFSSLNGPGLTWRSVDQPTHQISCSPSGFIVWRVYRGSAFCAIGKITGKSPAGTEWREVAREVARVTADDNVVW